MIYIFALLFLAMFVQALERFIAHLHLSVKRGWLFLMIASFMAFIISLMLICNSLGIK